MSANGSPNAPSGAPPAHLTPEPLVSAQWAAVVVNFRSGSMLSDCVDALIADTSAGTPEIVVVDNGSEDGSVDTLRARHPDVPVLRPGANLGYARAANLGIAATAAPIVSIVGIVWHELGSS